MADLKILQHSLPKCGHDDLLVLTIKWLGIRETQPAQGRDLEAIARP
jgi:hypothetical protein